MKDWHFAGSWPASRNGEDDPQADQKVGDDFKSGTSQGGHLVVGSIKFMGGIRKDVLAKLAEMIVACGVDQEREAKGGAAMG